MRFSGFSGFGILPFPEGHPSLPGGYVTPTYVVYERQSTEKETVEKVPETPIFADPQTIIGPG